MSLAISHKENQFCMVVQNQWSNSSNNNFLDHFAWLCEINLGILLILQPIFLLWSISHSHVKFSHDHENLQYLCFWAPFYLMSLFHLLRKVRLRLEKIQRDFLWGGGALAQKPHLVRWSLVCLEKSKGGLGVRNLALMNSALLCKWNWRFAN